MITVSPRPISRSVARPCGRAELGPDATMISNATVSAPSSWNSCSIVHQEQSRIRALEPGEIEDVRRVRDEERLLERLLQSLDARIHGAAPTCWTMNSSASR